MNKALQVFPTLFKRNANGSTQQWIISVEEVKEDPFIYGAIVTDYGQVDGAQVQSRDVIKQGKNPGRKNATTPVEQALAEAKSKWTKKIERHGYVQEMERAQAGEDNAQGGVWPMLAKVRADVEDKLAYPCDYQHKYNGIYGTVDVVDGAVSLWTRKRQRIISMPHIEAAYTEAFAGMKGKTQFGGEFYRHGWHLQTIGSFVGQKKTPKPGYEEIYHVVYDLPSSIGTWSERRAELKLLFEGKVKPDSGAFRLAPTTTANSAEHATELQKKSVALGYEGGMLRQLLGLYMAGKRTHLIAKVKDYKDAEFNIVAVKEGRGKFAGLAIFTCVTKEGKEFDCCPPGNLEDRAKWLKRGPELIGKPMTVKYFDFTQDGLPYQPVGMALRTYE